MCVCNVVLKLDISGDSGMSVKLIIAPGQLGLSRFVISLFLIFFIFVLFKHTLSIAQRQ